MLLVLVRHADSPPGSPDSERPLSPTGDEQARTTGSALCEKLSAPTSATIWCSPLLRARQTAQYIARALGVRDAPSQHLFLTPDGSAAQLLAALASLRGDPTVIAITHEHFVSSAAQVLLGATAQGFRTAEGRAIALERCEPGSGRLLWRVGA